MRCPCGVRSWCELPAAVRGEGRAGRQRSQAGASSERVSAAPRRADGTSPSRLLWEKAWGGAGGPPTPAAPSPEGARPERGVAPCPPSRRETPAGPRCSRQPGDLQLRFRPRRGAADSLRGARTFMPGGKLGRGRVWGGLSLLWPHLASRPQRQPCSPSRHSQFSSRPDTSFAG